ncbi:MAG: thioredoxin-dependent thiol peroxidase [Acidobacteria bacterium]|nr:thioredoxin-dependent thiol peroxidase [Acidobacteriota bacterium]
MAEGSQAPEIRLLTDEGTEFSLSSLNGQSVVLYFYPKANTPGCTKESCSFRDVFPNLRKVNAVVLGISPDGPAAQVKFRKKYGLPFTLLCDTEHAVAEAYGVWVEKSMYGKKYMGIERTTFVIGEDGKIAKVFPKVKVDGHAEEVLAALS